MDTISQYRTYTNHKILKSILEETFKNFQKNSRDLCGVDIQVKNTWIGYNYLGQMPVA